MQHFCACTLFGTIGFAYTQISTCYAHHIGLGIGLHFIWVGNTLFHSTVQVPAASLAHTVVFILKIIGCGCLVENDEVFHQSYSIKLRK